jgi:hypothetical protein
MAQIVSPLSMGLRINEWAFLRDAGGEAPAESRTVERPSRGRRTEMPISVAFVVYAAWIAGALALLARRVKAVEVVG